MQLDPAAVTEDEQHQGDDRQDDQNGPKHGSLDTRLSEAPIPIGFVNFLQVVNRGVWCPPADGRLALRGDTDP